eukprot:CAMPEP_0178423014 /NCGR_PEP_ID=MMETSP0689_2-20121128/27473_1 /TAXON_ID=160604 /ORGANISM="Amphidinium massartii, Strain CS-259" /LENGTH=422 /DNA_ID=CAMNT_0020044601 /DNA_START=21 /DNA_END=1289 /DNA_ORIENTATION=+
MTVTSSYPSTWSLRTPSLLVFFHFMLLLSTAASLRPRSYDSDLHSEEVDSADGNGGKAVVLAKDIDKEKCAKWCDLFGYSGGISGDLVLHGWFATFNQHAELLKVLARDGLLRVDKYDTARETGKAVPSDRGTDPEKVITDFEKRVVMFRWAIKYTVEKFDEIAYALDNQISPIDNSDYDIAAVANAGKDAFVLGALKEIADDMKLQIALYILKFLARDMSQSDDWETEYADDIADCTREWFRISTYSLLHKKLVKEEAAMILENAKRLKELENPSTEIQVDVLIVEHEKEVRADVKAKEEAMAKRKADLQELLEKYGKASGDRLMFTILVGSKATLMAGMLRDLEHVLARLSSEGSPCKQAESATDYRLDPRTKLVNTEAFIRNCKHFDLNQFPNYFATAWIPMDDSRQPTVADIWTPDNP